MDFFERIFHVSPDGGNGLAELMFLLGFLSVVTCITFRKVGDGWRRRKTLELESLQ
jgi:hypothetical protein